MRGVARAGAREVRRGLLASLALFLRAGAAALVVVSMDAGSFRAAGRGCRSAHEVIAEALAQFELVELAGGRQRNLIDEHHVLGLPPPGDLAFEEGDHSALVERRARLGLHD